MTQFKVVHERFKCISCGACQAVSQKFWEMDGVDTKSNLIGAKVVQKEPHVEELELKSDADVEENKLAAQVCPVTCIHVKPKAG